MATVKVYAPNRAFSGPSVGGVVFADGVAEIDRKEDAGALAYFRRQGYGIGRRAAAEPEAPERVDAREATSVVVGTPLRDAAVDPKPEDFLPPINAGKADPHGPAVVAPEIHASGTKGIKPGEVHVGEAEEQQADETALAASVLIEGEPHPTMKADVDEVDMGPIDMSDPGSVEAGVEGAEENQPPAKSASKAAWVDWAVAQGANRDEAEEQSRADLIETYGG